MSIEQWAHLVLGYVGFGTVVSFSQKRSFPAKKTGALMTLMMGIGAPGRRRRALLFLARPANFGVELERLRCGPPWRFHSALLSSFNAGSFGKDKNEPK